MDDGGTLKTLHFGLCLFTGVQERRKFGPLVMTTSKQPSSTAVAHPPSPPHPLLSLSDGIRNTPYEFTASDLAVSAKQLQLFLQMHQSSPPTAEEERLAERCRAGRRGGPASAAWLPQSGWWRCAPGT